MKRLLSSIRKLTSAVFHLRLLRLLRIARQQAHLEVMQRWSNYRRAPTEIYRPENIHRILIPRPEDNIGDSLMLALFLKATKLHRPDIEITVASGPQTDFLYHGSDFIDHFISTGDRATSRNSRIKALNREIEKRERFDLVVDLRTPLNPRIFSFLRKIDAQHYLGYAKDNHALFDLNVSSNEKHMSRRWLAASQIITGDVGQPIRKPSSKDFYFPVDIKEPDIKKWQDSLPPSRARILFNFYASSRHRCFPYMEALKLLRLWLERFPGDLAQLLSVPGHERDVNKLANEIDKERVVVTPSPLSLSNSFTLTRQADLVFTPDTGMVHIASSLNSPIIAIYNDDPHNFSEWRPLSDIQAVIFTRPPAFPDERVNIHEFDHAKMWDAMESLLDRIIPNAIHNVNRNERVPFSP